MNRSNLLVGGLYAFRHSPSRGECTCVRIEALAPTDPIYVRAIDEEGNDGVQFNVKSVQLIMPWSEWLHRGRSQLAEEARRERVKRDRRAENRRIAADVSELLNGKITPMFEYGEETDFILPRRLAVALSLRFHRQRGDPDSK